MIAVTLGTHTRPMDRLMLALDTLVSRAEIREEVIVTAAAYGIRPAHLTTLGIQPFDDLRAMIDAATAVVTHGGPASIALAMAAGHTPVVVPRDPAFREHVDDHQIRFAVWLAARREVFVVRDMTDLGVALNGALSLHVGRGREPFLATEAVTRLRAIINSDD